MHAKHSFEPFPLNSICSCDIELFAFALDIVHLMDKNTIDILLGSLKLIVTHKRHNRRVSKNRTLDCIMATSRTLIMFRHNKCNVLM